MADNPFVPQIIPQAGNLDLPLISNYDLQTPLWAPVLYQPYGGQGIDILHLFKAMGGQVPVVEPTGEHWEEDRYMAAFQSRGNVAAPGAGNNVVITLAVADIDPTTFGSFPIIGDVVSHIPTDAKYQVVAKTSGAGTTLTLRPLKTTTNEAITANDYFFIATNSVAERSTQRDTQSSFQTKYEWFLQNFRNDYSISGNAMTEQLKPVRFEDGGSIVGWATMATAQSEYKHLLAHVGAMIWGETADNTGLNMTNMTTGMVEQFRARAVSEDTGGTLTVADFEAMEEVLSSNWAVGNYLTLLSGKSFNEISNDMISDFNQTNMNAVQNQLSNALFGTSGFDVSQLAATYTFKGLVINGKNFALKRLTLLDDPTQAAAGSMTNKQRDYGFVLPIGRTVDPKGAPRNYVEMKYKDYAGQKRLMKMWETGGSSRKANTAVDDNNLHILTELGFDFYSLQQCGIFLNGSLS